MDKDTTPQPLISFIVSCYDLPAEMLTECIESLLALSLNAAEREIIVVDDGSQQSPMPTLEHFGDDIIYVRKPNGGVSTARNMGLQMATGTYVQFIDGDDALLRTAYEHCVDLARYGGLDVVMFNYEHTPPPETPTFDDSQPLSGSELMRTQNLQGSACAYLFRRSIVGNLRFTPGVCYGEDELFTPQLLLRAEKVVRTNAVAYHYRQRTTSAIGNTSQEGIVRRLSDNLGVIRQLNRLADTLPAEEHTALQRRVAQLTMDYIYNIITLTRDRQQLDSRLAELQQEGLFPLPDRDYTQKYVWFRRLTQTSWGRSVMMRVLPMMKREK